jgi:hypothetical protein
MKRLLVSCFAIFAVSFAAWAGSPPVIVAAGGGGADPEILKADEALRTALKNKNAKDIEALLDQKFTWTNEAGQTRAAAEFLKDAAAGGADNDIEYKSVKATKYGQQLATVTGTGTRTGQPDVVFVRVWVKQQPGWRLLAHQATRILSQQAASQAAPVPTGVAEDMDCENPCQNVPYTPETPDQAAVVKTYQAVETAVTRHDNWSWAYRVADEFVGIGRRYTGVPDAKAERVKQITINTNVVILPPMLSLQVFTFGDAAIMIADHQPSGEKPYHVIRIWVKRDGRWQLFHRQETTIEKPAGSTAQAH